jgi:hypothetical protein
MLLIVFHEIERKRILPNSFHEASINLIPKREGGRKVGRKGKIIDQFL